MPDRPLQRPAPSLEPIVETARERFMEMDEDERLAHIDKYGIDLVLDEIRD